MRSIIGAQSFFRPWSRSRCMAKYGLFELKREKAWNEARHGLLLPIFGRGCLTACVRSAQSLKSGPKSLVSLSSVVLLQRSLVWILRALEVKAHSIHETRRIPGCGVEGRTSNRDRHIFIRWKLARKRVQTRLAKGCMSRESRFAMICFVL